MFSRQVRVRKRVCIVPLFVRTSANLCTHLFTKLKTLPNKFKSGSIFILIPDIWTIISTNFSKPSRLQQHTRRIFVHNSYHSTTQHNHTSPKVDLSLSYIKLFLIFSKNENWWRYNTSRAYYRFGIRTESVHHPVCLVKNPATNIAVERANQYIFLKQLRFIIYMRLGDTVYQPWVETLLSTLAAPQNLYFVELTC